MLKLEFGLAIYPQVCPTSEEYNPWCYDSSTVSKGFDWVTCHFGLTTKYLTIWAVCILNTMKSLKVGNPWLLNDHMCKLLQGRPVADQLLLSSTFHSRIIRYKANRTVDPENGSDSSPGISSQCTNTMPAIIIILPVLSWLCSLQRTPTSLATAVAQIYRSTPD